MREREREGEGGREGGRDNCVLLLQNGNINLFESVIAFWG